MVQQIIPTVLAVTADVEVIKADTETNLENKYLESSVIDKSITNDKSDKNIITNENKINELNSNYEINMDFTYFMKNLVPFLGFIVFGSIGCYAAGVSIENLVSLNKSNLAISWTVLTSLLTIVLMSFVIVDYFEDQEWYLAQLTMSGDELELSRREAHQARIYQKAYNDAWDEIMRQVYEADAQQNAAVIETVDMDTYGSGTEAGAGAGTDNLPNFDNSSDTTKDTNEDYQTIFWLNTTKLGNSDIAAADTTAETVNMENQIITPIDKKNQ